MKTIRNFDVFRVYRPKTQYIDVLSWEDVVKECQENEELYKNYSQEILFYNNCNVKPKQKIYEIKNY